MPTQSRMRLHRGSIKVARFCRIAYPSSMNSPVSKNGKAWSPNLQTINFERLNAEVIAIHMASGFYFSMENAAAHAWAGIEEGCEFRDLAARLLAAYEVAPDRIESDLSAFLDHLLREELVIEKIPEKRATLGAPTQRLPYKEIKLEKFTDLEFLLKVDPVHDVQEEGWPHAKDT